MERIVKKTYLLLAVALSSCFSNAQPYKTSSKPSSSSNTLIELSYDDVKGKTIFWSNIFSIDSDDYYVYFFSKTCSHCQNLKQFIIEKALARGDIYFVESSDEDVFVKDVSITIGLTSIEGFGILGYPSLVEIVEKTITKNIAGIPLIRSELSIE